jgi:methionyl-tRNA formyltransferase
LRTVYLGTSPFAAAVLERLAAGPHRPQLVVTRPDRPKGRGRALQPPAVAVTARELGLDVIQPDRLHDPESLERIAAAEPDVLVLCAYGVLVGEPLLSRYELFNVHPSLLPRWRGAAPVERALLAGDVETGVSIIQLVDELDAGPIAAQRAFPIGPEDDAGTVYARSAELGAELVGDLVAQSHKLELRAQEGEPTYAEKITAADRELDLAQPVDALRRIRALSPHIGARAELHGRPVTIWRARLEGGELVPLEVQPDGRRRMSYQEFLRGLR